MKLLPRMSAMMVRQTISSLPPQPDNDQIGKILKELQSRIEWNAAGGSKTAQDEINSFHGNVLKIARDCGFQKEIADKSRFDRQCAAYLADARFLTAAKAETMRDDTWTFITSFLLLHITIWRFGLSFNRMRGGIRNTFQRLWIRANLLDRGAEHPERWLWLNSLTEDALVQLTEPPGLAANKKLAQAIAQVWVEQSKNRRNMEALMRAASRKILARNEIQMLSLLDEAELIEEIQKIFDEIEPVKNKPTLLVMAQS